MSSPFVTNPTRTFACLILAGLLFAILAAKLSAQAAPEVLPGPGIGPANNVARDVTFIGTIQEVVTQPEANGDTR